MNESNGETRLSEEPKPANRGKPMETDKRQPPQGVLWKVELNGGKIIKRFRLPKTFRK